MVRGRSCSPVARVLPTPGIGTRPLPRTERNAGETCITPVLWPIGTEHGRSMFRASRRGRPAGRVTMVGRPVRGGGAGNGAARGRRSRRLHWPMLRAQGAEPAKTVHISRPGHDGPWCPKMDGCRRAFALDHMPGSCRRWCFVAADGLGGSPGIGSIATPEAFSSVLDGGGRTRGKAGGCAGAGPRACRCAPKNMGKALGASCVR